jgi:hypothetical protein
VTRRDEYIVGAKRDESIVGDKNDCGNREVGVENYKISFQPHDFFHVLPLEMKIVSSKILPIFN